MDSRTGKKKCELIQSLEMAGGEMLILIVCDVIFCMLANHIVGDYSRFFVGPRLFLPQNCPLMRSGQFGEQKCLGPFEIRSNLCIIRFSNVRPLEEIFTEM